MLFGRRGRGRAHFYYLLQLRCWTQPPPPSFSKFYGSLEEKYFAFYHDHPLVTAPRHPHLFPRRAVLVISALCERIECIFNATEKHPTELASLRLFIPPLLST